MFLRTLLSSSLLLLCSLPTLAATFTPDPSVGNVDQHRRLYEIARNYADPCFDPGINLVHQKPRDHYIRESVYYAYGLLLTRDPADLARAQDIIRKVVTAQDVRANSAWRGAFLWRAEDSWATIKNPDLNSAAFVGMGLAYIAALDRKHPMLDPDVRKLVDEAGRLSVEAVMRRNVDPGYTNIALLSTGVAAAGEKIWSVPGAGAFAEAKLNTVLTLAGDGDCYEYLSPTYTAVDLFGAYTALKFAFSDSFKVKANAMIDSLWRQVASSYHAPSFQLGGPNNRSYGDDMLSYTAGLKYWLYLGLDGAYPLPDTEKDHGWDRGGLFLLADIPVFPRPEFKKPAPAWREFTAVGPEDGVHPTRHLSQFRDGNFILGTVAFQDEWKQKRNLVAYWRSDAPAPEGFRVGFCIDKSNETLPNGFPYAQVLFYCHQVKNAALVALVTAKDIPPSGGCALDFNTRANVVDAKDGQPLHIVDGAITAWLYPVSTAAATFQAQTDAHNLQVTRPWTSADQVGPFHVLSYLVVFRPSGQPAPQVSDLVLKGEGQEGAASANVDGVPMSVSFKS